MPTSLECLILGALACWLRGLHIRLTDRVSFNPGFPLQFGAVLLWDVGSIAPLVGGNAIRSLLAREAPSSMLLNLGADALRLGGCALTWRLLAGGGALAGGLSARALGSAALSLGAFLLADYLLNHAYARLAASGATYDPSLLLLDGGLSPLGLVGALLYANLGAWPVLLLGLPAVTAWWIFSLALLAASDRQALRKLTEENRVLAEQVAEAVRQTVQARKLAALGELAAGVAHEINNPLLVIQTNVELLQGTVQGEDEQDCLDLVEQAGLRCKAIVQKLLAFARTTALPRVALDTRELAEAAVGMMAAPFREAGVEVSLRHDHEAAVVGDRNELTGVLSNLLSNARDAVSGRVDGRVQVRTDAEEGWAVIEVSDNGPGMAADIVERVFEPFFTTKQVGEGTGLGLYLSYCVARDHGGEIRVNSAPGQGATFSLRLPAAVNR